MPFFGKNLHRLNGQITKYTKFLDIFHFSLYVQFQIMDYYICMINNFQSRFLSDLHSLAVQTRATHQVSFSGLVGTPLYMSPEQIEHSRCTEKVDIYSLGVIYFEMNYVFSSNHEKDKVKVPVTDS